MSSDSQDSQLPDLRYVRELAKVFKQYELDEIEIETGDQRILLRRSDFPAEAVAAPAPTPSRASRPTPSASSAAANERTEAPASVQPGDFITSPFVGTFYRAPRPDAPVFIEIGATVKPGTTLCIVEAMKLFNEIEVDFACVVEEVLADDGQAVEYGAKLFRVRKL